MTEYLEIIKSVIPSFEDEHLNEPFSNVGVDSIDLVTIRVDFERKVEKTIPDRDWMTFTSFAEVINYCEDFNTRLNAQGTQNQVSRWIEN